ncbi:MAG: DUF1553 domain-containing protein [Limisphaerales bacterium]
MAFVVLVAAASLFSAEHRAKAAIAPDRVDFNFHIRPLLSDRCFACHGPDDKARKANLDLHTREGALRGGKSGANVLNPGKPNDSELFKRITTSNMDEVMPPPDSKLPPLNPEEAALFRRWIAQGAEFKDHWAFIPPNPPAPPTLEGTTASNPIDAFVQARLATEGLRLQSEASKETLIRRLSLDLIGLPPTPSEIDAFLADTSPRAYENVVDRLLASEHYGERMAQEWMDLSRYADTYGYQADVDRDFSAWRDWVIRSLNQNLPWDRFITWQLAGDLLPDATRDQILATAFNRLHRQTNEGGSIEEEFRSEYVADRVHTMGTAFLGLTLECARCHDHKYDPIPTRDYYRLSGFFNSIDESGLYSHFTRATPTPVLLLWDGDQETRHDATVEAIRNAEASARAIRDNFDPGDCPTPPPLPKPPSPVAHLAFETIDGQRTPDSATTNLVTLQDGPSLVPGIVGQALRFSGDNTATIPHAGKFGRTDSFSFAFWLKPTEKQDRAVIFHASVAWTDSGSRGYEFVLDEGRPFFGLIHFWPGNAVAVRARQALPVGQWSQVTVTYDGSSRADGIHLYLGGEPLEVEMVRDHLYKEILHRSEWGDSNGGGVPLQLAGRFRDNGFKGGLIDEFQVFDTELTALEVLAVSRSTEAGARLPEPPSLARRGSDWFKAHKLTRENSAYRKALSDLHAARVAENQLVNPVPEIMVMRELPERRPTYVLRRGAYDAPTDPVEAGVPEKIAPFDPDLPRNRLGLARWVTDPQNPLTARVAVNRIWKLHFGRGLVATTWDFGAQGQLPSHPDLLDWLARDFIESGWNRKALHRRIVLSATYRQSSHASPELVARDPENRLLARGPRHRLEAEQIRDSALAVSGLLVPVVGGPSVKPHQPAGVWEDAGTGKSYKPDTGDKLYRRSLYTFWRRTAPPPNMLTFDATTREVCTAKRETTSTPLQALVLLNDPQFLEAARVLAEQLVATHPATPMARARDAFRRVIGRTPDARECEILDQLFAEQHAHFSAHPEAATPYARAGSKPPREDLPSTEVAATAVLASTLMNHDEFVMIR